MKLDPEQFEILFFFSNHVFKDFHFVLSFNHTSEKLITVDPHGTSEILTLYYDNDYSRPHSLPY